MSAVVARGGAGHGVLAQVVGRDPAAAREAARRILSSRRYRDVKVRRPFERQMRWIGHQLDRFFSWLGRLFDVAVPGSSTIAWIVFGVLAAVAVVWATRHFGLVRRRRTAGPQTAAAAIDADALERDAAEAEARGDLRRAIELRFRAGIARLDQEAGLVATKRTNAALRPIVPAPFAELGATFDAIHYGDASARPEDVARARRSWPEVVAGSKRSVDGGGRSRASRMSRMLRRDRAGQGQR